MAISATLVDSYTTTDPFVVHSKTGCYLGPASGDRIIVIAAGSRAGGAYPISGVKIGTIDATLFRETGSTGNISSVWYASVPSGTIADISVTYTGTVARGAFAVIALTGAQLVKGNSSASTQATASAVTTSVTPTEKGIALAVVWQGVSYQRLLVGIAPTTASAAITATVTNLTSTPVWNSPFSTLYRADLLAGSSQTVPSIINLVAFHEIPSISATSVSTLDSTTGSSLMTTTIKSISTNNLANVSGQAVGQVKLSAGSSATLPSTMSPGAAALAVLAQAIARLNDDASNFQVAMPVRAGSTKTLDGAVSAATATIMPAARQLASTIYLTDVVTDMRLRQVVEAATIRTLSADLERRTVEAERSVRQISAVNERRYI